MNCGKTPENLSQCLVYSCLLWAGCTAPTVSATDAIGPAEVDYPDQWYPMTDPEQLGRDYSGNRRDALPVGVASTPDSQRGQVALFNGGGLVFVPQMKRDFTISFWIKSSQLGPDSTAWAQGPRIINADIPGVHLDFNLSLRLDKLAMGLGTPGDAAADTLGLNSQRSVVDGTWHHVAIARDGLQGIWSMFVDGMPDSTRSGATGPLTLPVTISFGDLGDTSPHTPGLQAEVSNARTYGRVLSAGAIAFLATE